MTSFDALAKLRTTQSLWGASLVASILAAGLSHPAVHAQDQRRAVEASVSTSTTPPSDKVLQPTPRGPNLSGTEGVLDEVQITRAIAAINQARAREQVCGNQRMAATTPIRWDVNAMSAARSQALFLQQANQFGHTGENGSHVGDRLKATGFVWQKVGENLAAGFNSVEEVVISWLASPSHCRVLMTPEFNVVGVSYVAGEEDNTYANYWALVMAVPQPAN
jgi:uncharacterized protein YkwD